MFKSWREEIATASSLNATATGEAPSSICPAGWGLPRDGGDSVFSSGGTGLKRSYSNLLRGGNNWSDTLELSTALYGYGFSGLSEANGGVLRVISGSYMDSSVQISPLSFLRSGYLAWNIGSLDDRSVRGLYWSGYSYSSTASRDLAFRSTYVFLRYYGSHGTGYSLRCVAQKV